MNEVERSVAPLSPFTWGIAAGCSSYSTTNTAAANAVLHDISLLDLRFDLVLDEFAIPCNHTLHRINGGHPLQFKNLSLRQLQLLQYGVVIHGPTRLVLVAVPPCCGDSGACLAASYNHLFSRSLDVASTVARHPLLPEYTFIVYQLPEEGVGVDWAAEAPADGAGAAAAAIQRPEALFRLVYRNVNPHSSTSAAADFDVGAAPEYKLVAVLVASSTYYGELQRVCCYRREWYANSAAARASGVANLQSTTAVDLSASQALPEPVAAEVRRTSSLSALCTCFARVLARFSAVENTLAWDASSDYKDGDEGVGYGADGGGGKADVERMLRGRGLPTVPGDAWSYQYTRDGGRLLQRIDVVERTKGVLQSWRDGALDLAHTTVQRAYPADMKATTLSEHCTHPPLSIEAQRTPCGLLLLLGSQKEVATQVVDNEIVSFLPCDASAANAAGTQSEGWAAVVYASPAAERLRRWILQGLVAAEVHNIHAVLLDLDPVSVLQPCVELLTEADGAAAGAVAADEYDNSNNKDGDAAEYSLVARLRYRRALLLVCQVAVETVERFVRHSGLVWKVTLAVREADAGSAVPGTGSTTFVAWCRGMLDLTREAEVRRETSALRNRLTFTDEGEEKTSSAQAGMLVPLSAAQGFPICEGGVPPGGDDEHAASLQVAPRVQAAVDGAVALYRRDAAGPAAPLKPNIVTKAKEVGLCLDEAHLYTLFRTFCAAARRRDDLLPASVLVELLTEEWTADSVKKRRYSTVAYTRLLCPLDSCGVPVTRASVQRFLRPFLKVMRDGGVFAGSRMLPGGGGASDAAPQTLNYAQFSMVVFAIAKM